MRRRDLLKAIGIIPIAGLFSGCREDQRQNAPIPKPSGKAHTLQILLEGAFAVVLQRNLNRITAFVPKPDPKVEELAHYFYFNDPENRKDLAKQGPKGYRFELGEAGLRKYLKADSDPYINPGFNDFVAETEKWRLPESLVTISLPFPRSINFTGRPLKVSFGAKALKSSGLMPTNHILEYGIEDEGQVGLKCNGGEGDCPKSPYCPPGIMRYYFGVRPVMNSPEERQKHAIKFFNFLLEDAFPDLKEKYKLAEIAPADDESPAYSTRPTDFSTTDAHPALAPAVLRSADPKPRLLKVASMVDCQSGGILVNTHSQPLGG